MTDGKRKFVEYEDLITPIYITVANGQHLKAQGTGAVRFTLDNGRTVKLTEVLHVPGLDKKLVSVAALAARGVLVQFKRDQAVLMSDNVTVPMIKRVGKLFAWNLKQHVALEAHKAKSSVTINDTSAIWNARLGHVSENKIMQAMKSCDATPRVVAPTDDVCDGCAHGKMTNIPFLHTS